MSDLSDALGFPIPPDEELDAEPCEPPADAEQADRQLFSLARLAERLREIEALAQAQVERVALWQQTEAGKVQRRYDWLEQGVTGWARAVHADDPAKKTIRLPNGEVAIRARQTRLEVSPALVDLDSLRQSRPRWVRERLEPDKSAIKGAVVASTMEAEIGPDAPEGYAVHHAVDKETGDLVPGVFLLVGTAPSVAVKPS